MTEPLAEIDYRVSDPLAGERVDRAISFISGLSRSKVSELINEGLIRKNGIPVKKGSEKTLDGDILLFPNPENFTTRKLQPDQSVKFSTVYEDEHVVVVDKPSGLVVHPGAGRGDGTLVNGLLARYPDMSEVGDQNRLGLVHRLDKGTSGLLIVARTSTALENLKKKMENREIDRQYFAILCGHLSSEKGIIEAPLGRDPRNPIRRAVIPNGKSAKTHYRVMEKYSIPIKATIAECTLETGRTHQIRAHFSAIGNPVLGDQLYGGETLGNELGRPALHSQRIEFTHPVTGKELSFFSLLPTDLANLKSQLS
ncbi:MAG TPA: RluA family pseudouridine synthase [Acidimicrobiales bacterium]|nr:RluA family pseudouridine synthase [Acidimicrobiales bacterium]HJM28111.1 RluA family pseudouridine synthase [Acidimicrobiales bacterium]HJM98535.1 RluA family pseudouridine synthase [Acidimicrobiales bacterium]